MIRTILLSFAAIFGLHVTPVFAQDKQLCEQTIPKERIATLAGVGEAEAYEGYWSNGSCVGVVVKKSPGQVNFIYVIWRNNADKKIDPDAVMPLDANNSFKVKGTDCIEDLRLIYTNDELNGECLTRRGTFKAALKKK